MATSRRIALALVLGASSGLGLLTWPAAAEVAVGDGGTALVDAGAPSVDAVASSAPAASPAASAPTPPPAAPAVPAAWASEGRRVYLGACASCHGEQGDGKGWQAKALDPTPRDFTTGVFKFRSTATGSLPLTEDVVRTLSEGIPGTTMNSWKQHLSLREMEAVADHVIAFGAAQHPEPPERLVPPTAEVKVPPWSSKLVARGSELYVQMGCPECHGKTGRSDGPAAATLKDDQGRKMVALDFTRGFYKGGATPVDVYRTYVTGIGGTPMPSYADAMPDESDRWALVYFVKSLSRRSNVLQYLFGVQTNWE